MGARKEFIEGKTIISVLLGVGGAMGARKEILERETIISVLLGGGGGGGGGYGCMEGIFSERNYNLSFIGGLWVQGMNF